MASGVSSPWGMSPPMVAGITNTLDYGDQHLTGELSLTSIAPTFNGSSFTSPLSIKNKSYYTHSFGKKSLKKINSDIKYLHSI
jgi:hypothetical protein